MTFELPADLEADAVHLLADFNSWQPVAFEKLKSGKWKLVQEVSEGRYQFRYMIDHENHHHFMNDPEADDTVPNDQGTENAVITC